MDYNAGSYNVMIYKQTVILYPLWMVPVHSPPLFHNSHGNEIPNGDECKAKNPFIERLCNRTNISCLLFRITRSEIIKSMNASGKLSSIDKMMLHPIA